jgi:tetratricopeptide (TPR) repeat protein
MPAFGDEPLRALEGRAAEQAALWSALEEARAGRGRLVLISGEAGIGKSALLQGLASRAAEAGIRPIWGRAWEFADAPAYFPVGPCLSALGLGAADLQSATPFALWEDVLAALSRASQSEPSLWLLEDLHAADLQTLDLLTFLAQPLRVLPALVVVTARLRDPRLGERGEQRLLRLARDGLDLRLAPLAADGVGRLARAHAGELSQGVIEQLLELTSGNPLFVIECARSLKARGQHDLRGVSPTIRQLVVERLKLLPDATRELLESGAVLGREFTAALLGRMHELLPARVIDQLLAALRSGVVQERTPGHYVFSHVVVQNAVYESVTAERRSALHHRARLALETLPESPEVSLERARHALGALTPETEGATVQLVLAAGRALEESGAFDRAHALYGRLRDKVASGELSRELRSQELLHMAEVAERAGKGAESRALSLSVLKRARETNDTELLSRAALELGRGLRPGLIDDELVAALREAQALLGETSSPLWCRLQARLAAALQPAPDPQGPVAMAVAAIEQARQLEDDSLLLEVLDVAGSACVEYAPADVRLRLSEDLLERASAARDFVRTQRARARLAFERAEQGGFDAFDLQVDEMLREATAAGRPHARIRPLLMASLSAANRGKTRESSSLITEAQQLLALTDDASLLLSLRAHTLSRACMLSLTDELERFEPALSQMVRGVPAAEFTLHALRSMVRRCLDRREAARDDLLAIWPMMEQWNTDAFNAILAEVAAYVGEREICSQLRERCLPHAGREAMGGHVSVSYEGPIDRLLGLLDAALGDLPSAERRLRESLELAERRGFSAWVAIGRYDLGNLLLQVGREREARPLLQAAAELAEQCEMTGLVARASARLGGGVTAPPSSPRSSALARLQMQREGELYRLELGELTARIRATRGAELLERLVAAPDQEIHVLALASDEAAATSESSAGDALDARALKQYRKRLEDLSELVAEAEARADLGRVEALRREQAALEREVARALGLGGKARQAGSTTERARVNVQRRLKDALERVSEASPELGQWLGRSLRTGTYCSFRPSS